MASLIRAARTLASTSWTRTISAPPAIPSAVVASVASRRWSAGRSSTRPSVDLRTSRAGSAGRARGAPRARQEHEVCSAVLPNPKPGSTMRSSRRTPAERPLERGAQVRDHLADQVRVAGLGAVVHDDERDAPRRGEPGEAVVRADAPDVVDQVGAGIEGGGRDRGLRGVDADRHRPATPLGPPRRPGRPAPVSSASSRARGRVGSTRRRCRAGRRLPRPSGGPARRAAPTGSRRPRAGRRRRTSRGSR